MRYLLTLKFDGSAYHGWQVQENALAVQTVVQNAVERVIGNRVGISGCSRTDSGVHANMYCCHFDADTSVPAEKFALAVNNFLPPDIAAVSARVVNDDFHARYSCTGKEYIYRFFNSSLRDPFCDKYSFRVKPEMNIDILNYAAGKMVGTHDFSSFCATHAKEGGHIRTVTAATVTAVTPVTVVTENKNSSANNLASPAGMVTFTVAADGFLYNMVRIMAGTLFRVAEGKIKPDDIPEIIESRDRSLAGPTLPPRGLFLNRVFY